MTGVLLRDQFLRRRILSHAANTASRSESGVGQKVCSDVLVGLKVTMNRGQGLGQKSIGLCMLRVSLKNLPDLNKLSRFMTEYLHLDQRYQSQPRR